MESGKGIFETKQAAAGNNGRSIAIPDGRKEGLVWLVGRLSKLINERLLTAVTMRDARFAAKNDGYPPETISLALKLGRMSPERRDDWRLRIAKAIGSVGFEIGIVDEDPKPDTRLIEHLAKLRALAEDRSEITHEITQTFAAAKDAGFDVPSLKLILKLAKLAAEDRSEWFARVDNMGAQLEYW